MKKLYIGLASLIMLMMLPMTAFAYAKSSDNSITIAQDQVINDDVYVAAESLTIDGIVNGDVYAVAGRVTIRGTVNGDVIAAGRLVEVTGVVSDDLRVAGNTISVTSGAKIGDSFSGAGSDIAVSRDSTIGGGVQVAGAAVSLDGSIGRGIVAGGESLNINAPVQGSVNVGTNKLIFGEKADIKGKVKYQSTSPAKIDDNAKFVVEPQQVEMSKPRAAGSLFGARIINAMIGFAMAFVTGLAIILINKRHTRHIANRIIEKPLQIMAIGLLAILAGVPLALFLMTTLVGIPLGVITLLMWGIGLYIAKIFTAVAFGDWVLRRSKNKKAEVPSLYKAVVTGLGIYYVISIIPVIGFLAGVAVTTAGFGALLTEIYRSVNSHNTK